MIKIKKAIISVADKSNLKNGCLEFAEGLEKRNYIMNSNNENLGELTNDTGELKLPEPITSNLIVKITVESTKLTPLRF